MPKPFEKLTTEQLLARLDKIIFKQLHIHHTWRPNKSNFDGTNHSKLQDGMYNYHTKTNGWTDIGQHVTLFPDGTFLTGRAFDVSPASIKGWNTGAFAVEMLGDFDTGHEKLEGAQKESILALARYFLKKYGESTIKFHREGPDVTKTCPGSGIDKTAFMKEAKLMGTIFKDVPDTRWSAKYIKAAKDLDIIRGDSDGNFRPEGYITREEAAVLIIRTYEKITGKKVTE